MKKHSYKKIQNKGNTNISKILISDLPEIPKTVKAVNDSIKKILLPNVETFTLEHQFGTNIAPANLAGATFGNKKHTAAYGHRMYNRAKKRIRRGIRYPL